MGPDSRLGTGSSERRGGPGPVEWMVLAGLVTAVVWTAVLAFR